MSRPYSLIAPAEQRLAEGRPVLTKEQVMNLTKMVIGMTSADTVSVNVGHTSRIVTRVANSQVLSGDDGDELSIGIYTRFGARSGISISTNQVDETSLRAMVQRCEEIARDQVGSDEVIADVPQEQDTYVPVSLWHDATVTGMTTTRGTVIPEIITAVTSQNLSASGFLGFMARSTFMLTKKGINAFCEETDSEVTMSSRGADGKSSGWAGQANRDWSKINPAAVAATSIDFAKKGAAPQALEPGRRTAILSPLAVVQIARHLAPEYDAYSTDQGGTAFSKPGGGNKIGLRMFDPRINMLSDPNDPEGGYQPFFSGGYASPKMSWVENGVLKNLAYSVGYAMSRGKPYAEQPWSIRITGGTTTIDQMIAQCQEGVYVNRLSSVDLVDMRTGMMTGVTRDGCFFVKNGKIDRPIKNFRFLESPFVFMNNIEAMGVPIRAAFGYTPPAVSYYDPFSTWPRRPVIVPPMMVRDFNFTALSDAV